MRSSSGRAVSVIVAARSRRAMMLQPASMPAPAEDFNYLVVSDLHLSEAERNPAGRFFHFDEDFADFLRHYRLSYVGQRRWRLIIDGDFIEFFQMTEAPDPDRAAAARRDPHRRPIAASTPAPSGRSRCGSWTGCCAATRQLLLALRRFLLAGNEIYILRGNHDVEMLLAPGPGALPPRAGPAPSRRHHLPGHEGGHPGAPALPAVVLPRPRASSTSSTAASTIPSAPTSTTCVRSLPDRAGADPPAAVRLLHALLRRAHRHGRSGRDRERQLDPEATLAGCSPEPAAGAPPSVLLRRDDRADAAQGEPGPGRTPSARWSPAKRWCARELERQARAVRPPR